MIRVRGSIAFALFILTTLSALYCASPAAAQEVVPQADNGSAAVKELIRTIEDSVERKRLVGRLELLLEANDEAESESQAKDRSFLAGVVTLVDELTHQVRETLAGVIRELARVPERVRTFAGSLSDSGRRNRVLIGAGCLVGLAVFSLARNSHEVARFPADPVAPGRVTPPHQPVWVGSLSRLARNDGLSPETPCPRDRGTTTDSTAGGVRRAPPAPHSPVRSA